MKIVLLSYGDLDYDGRLRGLVDVFSKIGQVYSYTRGKKALNSLSEVCNLRYFDFIVSSVKYARKCGKIDCLVLDNRKATIPGLIVKFLYRPKSIVQDCRELYLMKETKRFVGKIGCFFERKAIKAADLVICANKERAAIMKKEYSLSTEPLVYENIRKLEYESEQGMLSAKEKFSKFINDGEVKLISTSGCSIERTNDILVRNLGKIGQKCRLFLVGNSNAEDVEKIKEIAGTDVDRISIIGQLNQTELKYLISQCDIGIVNYGQYDTNNRYCASGKIYEFLYEGLPVVTTTNPPLVNMCNTYHIGMADDQYYDAVNNILENYDSYKRNVKDFVLTHKIEDNDSNVSEKIKKVITYLVRDDLT